MIAAEFKNAVSTIRIHDEYCEASPTRCISQLGRIVSESYKRRKLSDQAGIAELAAANIDGNTAKS